MTEDYPMSRVRKDRSEDYSMRSMNIVLTCSIIMGALAMQSANSRPIQTTDPKIIGKLKRQQTKKNSFWIELNLGQANEKQGKVDEAIDCYKNAAGLATARVHYMYLVWAWERILESRPFAPEIHIALAKTFYKSPTPQYWDSEIHCRRAIYLSPSHRNVDAEALLKSIEKARKTKRLPTEKPEMIEFKSELKEKWSPPIVPGYVIARVRVAVGANLQFKEVRQICRSGDEDFDQSVLKSIKTAPFERLTGLQVPGLFDFAFVSDDNHHEISYISFGSVVIP